MLGKMKPDQERVKNLLLDTVTLLCKNSLQYESKLRVEGLLGVSVDDNDVFFLHISENFRSATCSEDLNGGSNKGQNPLPCSKEKNSEKNNDSAKSQQNDTDVSPRVVIKSELVSETNSDDLSVSTASLNSPQTVSQPSAVIAGQRRSPFRRKRSPFHDNAQNSSQNYQGNLAKDSLNSSQGNQDEDYSYQEAADGTSFDQFGDPTTIKQEAGWDQPPPSKRHTGETGPWPNLSGISEMAAQAAHMADDGSGEFSQPGCSSWSISNSQLQDSSMLAWRQSDAAGQSDASAFFSASAQQCHACPAVFTNVAALKKHVSVKHRPLKPWLCTVCCAAFARKDYLESHILTHTGERPYKCQLCESAFRQKGKLNKHMQTVHKPMCPQPVEMPESEFLTNVSESLEAPADCTESIASGIVIAPVSERKELQSQNLMEVLKNSSVEETPSVDDSIEDS